MGTILIQTATESGVPPVPSLYSTRPSLALCTTPPWRFMSPEGCTLESYKWDILNVIVRTCAGGAQTAWGEAEACLLYLQLWGMSDSPSVISGASVNWWKPWAALFFLPILAFKIEPFAVFTWCMPQPGQRGLNRVRNGQPLVELAKGYHWACGMWWTGRRRTMKEQGRELF